MGAPIIGDIVILAINCTIAINCIALGMLIMAYIDK